MNLAELHARLGETEVTLEMASRREDEQAARIDAQDAEIAGLRQDKQGQAEIIGSQLEASRRDTAELKRLRGLEAAVRAQRNVVGTGGNVMEYLGALSDGDKEITRFLDELAACRAAKTAPEVES